MNVNSISMNQEDAQRKLAAVRVQLRRRADEEYEALESGYAALAEGTPLINLQESIVQAGLHSDHRPKLAVARADRRQVKVSWRGGSFHFNALKNHYQTNYVGDLVIRVPFPIPAGVNAWNVEGYALAPMVPPDVRPAGSLKEFFTLWEVEAWADRSLLARPDYDPLLLKHIAGDLYAVIAAWNLTPLEQAVMAGRRLD